MVAVLIIMLSRMVFRPVGMGLLARPAVARVAMRPVVRCMSSLPGVSGREEQQPKRGMATAVTTTDGGAKETALDVRLARSLSFTPSTLI